METDTATVPKVPRLLAPFVRPGDQIARLAGDTEALVTRQETQILHATIAGVGRPKPANNGELYAPATLPLCGLKPAVVFISATAIRRYFYAMDDDGGASLYDVLRVPEGAKLDQLRMAWRVRSIELEVRRADTAAKAAVERAFNILAHPDLRACYDALRRDEDSPPLFPYGGFGVIVVGGHLAEDGAAFFADRILAFKPETTTRTAAFLLRRGEFLEDRIVCRDPRRKLEVWIDRNAVPDLEWDLTCNRWKHWLKSRIEVEAPFVSTGTWRLRRGEWILRPIHIALPSRTKVTVPAAISEDLARARAMDALLGEHDALIRRIREHCEKAPVPATTIQLWLDEVAAPKTLKPEHVIWRPEYDYFYFEQLRQRSASWFAFRNEFIFALPNAIVADVPAAGHASYVFARPADPSSFLDRYKQHSRESIRRNNGNGAAALGFIGRVPKGQRTQVWLKDLLRRAGSGSLGVPVVAGGH